MKDPKSILVTALTLAFCAAALIAPSAMADEPKTLWQKCPHGSAAGQCSSPRGVAADPNTGNVYVVDNRNHRVNVFDPWGTFLQAWGWGVADGSPELQSCGPEASPPTAECQAGIFGVGAGQLAGSAFGDTKAVAVDSSGAVYVYESKACTGGGECDTVPHANRVQKFSEDGEFILTFGREVNQTKVEEREEQEANAEPVTVTAQEENLCTAASGDVCTGGNPGSGDGEFGAGAVNPIDPQGSFIAVAPDDSVWVGGQERIQVFSSGGEFSESIAVPGEGIRALALDPSGNAFVAYAEPGSSGISGPSKDNVVKLSPAGVQLCTAEVDDPRALATDATGRLYVASGANSPESHLVTIQRFSSSCVEDPAYGFLPSGLVNFDFTIGIASSPACGIEGNLYYANNSISGTATTSFLRAYYPNPDPSLCPPPPVPPSIEAQYLDSVAARSAVVRAEINPRFWPDATYYVQWGTGDCKSEPAKCEKTRLHPGAPLGGEADAPVKSGKVTLEGLAPQTTYHFRFVAQSGGGGPVYGVGEEACALDPECGEGASFTTYPLPLPRKTDCPNQAFRSGPSAALPDCRAYEMVSPVDKDGGDIRSLPSLASAGFPASLDQAASSGERLTYSSYRAFGDPQAAPYSSQYLASRGGGGWATDAISPPQDGPGLLELSVLDSSFQAFDTELCNAWVLQGFEPTLTPAAIEGYANLYRRQNCAGGAYEAMTSGEPSEEPSPGVSAPLPVTKFIPSVQGASADGSRTIFRAAGALAEGAARCTSAEKAANGGRCPRQLYERHEGQLELVCVLPSGLPFKGGCSAGGGMGAEWESRQNSVHHAISEDGERIFWTNEEVGPGRLFVRIGGSETKLISSADAWFWGAAADGSRVLFNVPDAGEGDLVLREVDSEAQTTIAGEVLGVMGQSSDAERIYFASREAIAAAGQNGEGDEAIAGQPNLYLYDAAAGSHAFVATLAAGDVGSVESAIHRVAVRRTSRVSGDGLHAAFTSEAPLTGAENKDAVSGQPVTEVFLYKASSGQLRCVSCNAGGARPRGRQTILSGTETGPWRAGWIPGWTRQTHPSRALAEDGSRLFFNTTTPLVLADTNGRLDVYEWREGGEEAACEDQGAELHLAEEGGCISLISSGQSAADSEFVDASANGRDVFFRTDSSLVAQDPGLLDIYDAREGGGFPPPSVPPPPCQGEACQSPPAAPEGPTPASQAFRGESNPPLARKPRGRCGRLSRRARRARAGSARLARKARRVESARSARRLRKKSHALARRAKRLNRSASRCRVRSRRAGSRARG